MTLATHTTLLEEIGGEAALRQLVEDFYDLVEVRPEAAHILQLHLDGHGLANVRREQVDFLSGFLGGRRHYEERHGHMNLREIHEHLPITTEDANGWMICMEEALAKNGHSGPRIDRLKAVLRMNCLRLVTQPQTT